MDTIAAELETAIKEYFPLLSLLTEVEFSDKPSPVKWSKKEIIGHLIDSAQTNIRRFVIAQYEENPFIIYDQDKWVAINNYQHQPTEYITRLWYLLNQQMVNILRNTADVMAQRTCKTSDIHSIEWLASDYIKHLKHHLHQALDLEPIGYP